MDFVVVDVETANSDSHSVCQIGIASFRDGALAETWQSLVDPRCRFDRWNVAIHGISAAHVAGAPCFPEVFAEVHARFHNRIVASHTAFDRHALSGAAALHGLELPPCRWLDTARVARRAWPEYAKGGFGLANLSRRFGIQFRHHDALEDARAAGEVLLRAMSESGRSAEEWLQALAQPPPRRPPPPPNPDGPLFGRTVVFAGGLHMPRAEAARLAAEAGLEVRAGLSRDITLLVVGGRTSEREMEAKLRRAGELIRRGSGLEVVDEREFLARVMDS